MAWRRLAILAMLVVSSVPRVALSVFHVAVIDEVMTSYNGDATAQFVEIRMLSGGQNVVGGSVLTAFDDTGSYLGIVLTVSGNVPNSGAGVRWIMGSSELTNDTGFAPDKTFSGPLYLPTGGGMVCWGKPSTPSNPNDANYVDCLAYGTYSGPTNSKIGTPTPLDADGHSLQRTTSGASHNNSTDFTCADPATPTDNSGNSQNLVATTACPCGNNVVEFTEECDGTDDAACPGQCLGNCRCAPPQPKPAPVPSLPCWGVAALLLMLSGTGVLLLKRRQRAQPVRA
jgi:hypothetical protein